MSQGLADRAAPAAPISDAVTVRVRSRTMVADGVVEVVLEAAGGGRLRDWTPGSHIDLVVPSGLTRQYSLCGDRWDPDIYRIAVLREPASRGGSASIHDDLKVGDLLGVGGPRNNFPLVPATEYLFVAGGIGITPILPMIEQAERVGASWRLLYGGRTRASMAFVDTLRAHGDRVTVSPQDENGLLDVAAFLGEPRDHLRVYACGPAALLAAVETACAAWPAHTLHLERFVADDLAAPARTEPFEVELARSGRSVMVAPGTSILDAVAGAGVDVLSSCRRGVCGTCVTEVIDGRPDHRDAILEDHERDAGDCMFICVSRSLSDRLVLDL